MNQMKKNYGDEGIAETIKEIKKNGRIYAGAGLSFEEAYELKIIEERDIKVGFLSFCEGEFGSFIENEARCGYAWINHKIVNEKIIFIFAIIGSI